MNPETRSRMPKPPRLESQVGSLACGRAFEKGDPRRGTVKDTTGFPPTIYLVGHRWAPPLRVTPGPSSPDVWIAFTHFFLSFPSSLAGCSTRPSSLLISLTKFSHQGKSLKLRISTKLNH